MILKNVVACLAVLAFVTGSTCAMDKNVDNQQKAEKQEKIEKIEKKNNQSNNQTTKKDNKDRFKPVIGW